MSEGATTELTHRDKDKSFRKPTASMHQFVLNNFHADVLEVQDMHFNHDSAVLLADFRKPEDKKPKPPVNPNNPNDPNQLEAADGATGDADHAGHEGEPDHSADHNVEHITAIAVMAAALKFAKDHPDRTTMLTGHTDRSGSDAYNLKLSQLRADNVRYAITGQKTKWASSSQTKHKTEDVQQLLKWLADEWGWPCDPGKVDNSPGTDTSTAVKNFKSTYNVEFFQSIPVNTAVDQSFWEAMFDCYMLELAEATDSTAAQIAEMQAGLKFISGFEAVGCGENFPISKKQKSRIDRRVEIVFFEISELPLTPLPCHPSATQCKKDLCEINNRARYVLSPITVEPVLARKHRLQVALTLVWKGPDGKEHLFPKDMPVTVAMADGSEKIVPIEPDSLLDFYVDKRQASFTLKFKTGENCLVTLPAPPAPPAPAPAPDPAAAPPPFGGSGAPPAGPEELLLPPADTLKKVKDDSAFFFRPPATWELKNTDWTLESGKTSTWSPATALFENLSTVTTIGSQGAPIKFTLDPHWSFFKFEYFDRKQKKRQASPALVFEAFNAKPAAATDVAMTQSNWKTAKDNQALPWMLRKDDAGAALNKPDKDAIIQLRTAADTFIDGTDAAPKLVTKSPPGGSDTGLNVGDSTTIDFTKATPQRMSFYDLPPLWKSQKYFVKHPGAGTAEGLWEDLAPNATTDAQPWVFNLDDTVLFEADTAGAMTQPLAWAAANRCAIFCNTFDNKDAAGTHAADFNNIGLFKPDTAGKESYFTKKADAVMTRTDNIAYIHKGPDWVRLVVFDGSLFDAFDKRTPDSPDGVVGARAAVRWSDIAGLPAPGSNSTPGAVVSRDFFTFQSYFKQTHPDKTIGRFDTALLRCCDIAGNDEVGVSLTFLRICFNFNNPGFDTASFNNDPVPLGLTGAAAKAWGDTAISNLLTRWNGPEAGRNAGPPTLVPKAGSGGTLPKFKAKGIWFSQSLARARCHYECNVFQSGPSGDPVRAFMRSAIGEGLLDQTDNSPKASGWFTFAHEIGHGASLSDEYIESSFSTPIRLDGFDCNIPGDPHAIDSRSMMSGNIEVRARHHWHLAEWIRANVFSNNFTLQVKHGNAAMGNFTFELPHHASTPASTHVTQTHTTVKNHTTGPRGRFDIFFYPLGKDRYSQNVLGASVSKPSEKFDGIVVIMVKMRFNYDVTNKTTIGDSMSKIDAAITSAFNGKFKVAVPGRATNALLHFSPRYWETTLSKASPSDTAFHKRINTAATGTSSWSAAGASATLSWPRSNAELVFVQPFREMIGLGAAGPVNATTMTTVVSSAVPNAVVTLL